MTFRRNVPRLLGILALGCFVLTADRVRAEDRAAVEKVTELNRKALAAYENLDFEEARKLLKQALDLCVTGGLDKHKMKARTHIHLGTVLVSGFKQRELGIKQFRKAIEVQPDIGLTKSVANPDLQSAFDEAKAGGGAEETPPEESAPPPSPPPPPPVRDTPPDDISGLYHETVGEAVKKEVVEVKAAVGADIEFDKVVLAYRPKGATDFLARDMEQNEKGWFVAEIPAAATDADIVAYYIEVRNKAGQPVAANGSARTPNIVSLGDAPPPKPVVEQATGEEEEGAEGEEGEEGEEDSGGRKYFVGVSVGSGLGWASGNPEVNFRDQNNNEVQTLPGLAPTQLMHLAPEFGIFLEPDFALSIQLRAQLVTGANEVQDITCPGGDEGSGVKGTCKPSPGAFAVFARATWFFGDEDFQPYFSVAVGGGEIRHVVDLSNVPSLNNCGPDGKQGCIDTVRTGLFLAGPGGGFLYKLNKSLSLNVGSNLQIGVPYFSINADLNVGVALAL